MPSVEAIITRLKEHTTLIPIVSLKTDTLGDIYELQIEFPMVENDFSGIVYFPFWVEVNFYFARHSHESLREKIIRKHGDDTSLYADITGQSSFKWDMSPARPLTRDEIWVSWDSYENYLAYALQVVLLDLGGEYYDSYASEEKDSILEIPDWAYVPWQGKQWWHQTTNSQRRIRFRQYLGNTLSILALALVIGMLPVYGVLTGIAFLQSLWKKRKRTG